MTCPCLPTSPRAARTAGPGIRPRCGRERDVMSGVVLVTGGAGYIGSHVSKALAESGFTPVCYDTLEKGHPWAVRWGPLECGDIGDAARLEEVFARHKPRAIVHMAGYIEVGESVRQPERYLHNNATKSGVLVAAAVRHGVDAFVFSSTCAVYGTPQTEKLDETPHRSIPTPSRISAARRSMPLRKSTGLVATMTRTVPVGPIRRSPS